MLHEKVSPLHNGYRSLCIDVRATSKAVGHFDVLERPVKGVPPMQEGWQLNNQLPWSPRSVPGFPEPLRIAKAGCHLGCGLVGWACRRTTENLSGSMTADWYLRGL